MPSFWNALFSSLNASHFLPSCYLSFEHCNASVRILMNSLCCWSPRLWGSSRRVQWEQSIPERRPAPGWPRRQGSRWMRCCRWQTPFRRLPELTKGQTSFPSCESLFSKAPQSTLCDQFASLYKTVQCTHNTFAWKVYQWCYCGPGGRVRLFTFSHYFRCLTW